jgi:hypothetical protein
LKKKNITILIVEWKNCFAVRRLPAHFASVVSTPDVNWRYSWTRKKCISIKSVRECNISDLTIYSISWHLLRMQQKLMKEMICACINWQFLKTFYRSSRHSCRTAIFDVVGGHHPTPHSQFITELQSTLRLGSRIGKLFFAWTEMHFYIRAPCLERSLGWTRLFIGSVEYLTFDRLLMGTQLSPLRD